MPSMTNGLIELGGDKLVTLDGRTIETNKLRVGRMVDVPAKKEVRVTIDGFPNYTVLWEGAAYDAIGQWTDQNAVDRIMELVQIVDASSSSSSA